MPYGAGDFKSPVSTNSTIRALAQEFLKDHENGSNSTDNSKNTNNEFDSHGTSR